MQGIYLYIGTNTYMLTCHYICQWCTHYCCRRRRRPLVMDTICTAHNNDLLAYPGKRFAGAGEMNRRRRIRRRASEKEIARTLHSHRHPSHPHNIIYKWYIYSIIYTMHIRYYIQKHIVYILLLYCVHAGLTMDRDDRNVRTYYISRINARIILYCCKSSSSRDSICCDGGGGGGGIVVV